MNTQIDNKILLKRPVLSKFYFKKDPLFDATVVKIFVIEISKKYGLRLNL